MDPELKEACDFDRKVSAADYREALLAMVDELPIREDSKGLLFSRPSAELGKEIGACLAKYVKHIEDNSITNPTYYNAPFWREHVKDNSMEAMPRPLQKDYMTKLLDEHKGVLTAPQLPPITFTDSTSASDLSTRSIMCDTSVRSDLGAYHEEISLCKQFLALLGKKPSKEKSAGPSDSEKGE